MENKEIRRKILEYLYQRDEENPQNYVSKQKLIGFLDVEGKKVDTNILYLEEKGYVELIKGIGAGLFSSARINSYGKDLVENADQFNIEFPIRLTQNIVTNSPGTIIGNDNIQTIEVSKNFNLIYEKIEKINPEKKEEIKSAVKSIEEELNKNNTNKSTVKKSLDFLKQNAPWIVPTIIELIKASFGV